MNPHTMVNHLNIKINGLVQGIFYRATAKEEAEQLGINGFARNEPDGSVYIEVEGEEEDLNKFLDWCHKGPPLAKVEKVESSLGTLKKFLQFEVY